MVASAPSSTTTCFWQQFSDDSENFASNKTYWFAGRDWKRVLKHACHSPKVFNFDRFSQFCSKQNFTFLGNFEKDFKAQLCIDCPINKVGQNYKLSFKFPHSCCIYHKFWLVSGHLIYCMLEWQTRIGSLLILNWLGYFVTGWHHEKPIQIYLRLNKFKRITLLMKKILF